MNQLWMNWSNSSQPKEYLIALQQAGLLPDIINALLLVPQDNKHHPEGDVFQHTLCVVDAAKDIAVRDNVVGDERIVLMFAALCHDLGKPSTTEFNIEKGYITAYGHDKAGVVPATDFLKSIGLSEALIIRVARLVATHMSWVSFFTPEITNRNVRRLANKIAPNSFNMWLKVVEADISGRPPLPKGIPSRAQEIVDKYNEMLREGIID